MAKAIMIQGTMSNAGKSLIAAGLCRIFHQDGYRVAPFKAQNMALNSFITKEGLEMGRAQVMQAEAAGVVPSVRMNPILLKPTNDTGSQVIVNGEVLGNMDARSYFACKKNLVPKVQEAYDSLAADNDIIVIEGAGSPAEINLKDDDAFVNMGMAKLAQAPVMLVGHIDRGGVYAQLVGQVDLLEEDERSLVKGLVINKFRGDRTMLEPGVAMREERAGIPVVGVAPYLNIEVGDEDSLTERFNGNQEVGLIDIAVVRIPRISNFTDFNPFERMPGVSLRYVQRVGDLKNPDMIILPGTKNTMEDLLWMRQNGMEAAILKAAASGTIIFGVCGGYQMLGETLADPLGVEAGGTIKGMSLLPMDTVFAGRVEFYENCGKEDWTLKSVFQAHERGQTTRAYPKKGYRVDLISVTSTGVINKNKEKVLGMRKSDSWIFYAIYSDGTKVRDQFNTRIWDRLGAWDTPYDTRFGTSMKYVELVVNGEYRGLYGIFEPIDSTQLEISDQEYLYKRTYGRELLAETMDSVAPSEYLTVLGMELKGRNGQGNGEDWKCFRTFVEM